MELFGPSIIQHTGNYAAPASQPIAQTVPAQQGSPRDSNSLQDVSVDWLLEGM